jgi:SAGA-associated factor 29
VLANVLSFNEDADTYKMQDAEDAANVFEVGMDALLPLLQEHEKDPSLFFAKDERVLALYPQTTTFYPALVIASAKRRKQNDYVLTFDEEVEKRIVEWMYVLPLQRGLS